MGKNTDEQIDEIPLELKADVDAELVEEFISDAREQLQNIEQGTLALEKDAQDQEVLNTLFRAFHTFKGNAGFLDLTAVSQLAHMLESLLEGARENRLKINSVIIEIILKFIKNHIPSILMLNSFCISFSSPISTNNR